MSKIVVYKVQLYDAANDAPVVSRRMATLNGVEKMNGTVIEGTGYTVDSTDLENGQQWTAIDFDPVALGYSKSRI